MLIPIIIFSEKIKKTVGDTKPYIPLKDKTI